MCVTETSIKEHCVCVCVCTCRELKLVCASLKAECVLLWVCRQGESNDMFMLLSCFVDEVSSTSTT